MIYDGMDEKAFTAFKATLKLINDGLSYFKQGNQTCDYTGQNFDR